MNVITKVILLPVWAILGVVQLLGTFLVNIGTTVMYILSGVFSLTLAACLLLKGESLTDIRYMMVTLVVLWILPRIMIFLLSRIMILKLIVGERIFG